MILVLASIADEAAPAFVHELARDVPTALLTCADLAAAPLRIRHPDFERSTLYVAGRVLPVGQIAGAVNLLTTVLPQELICYEECEREYQAAEMHALLTYLLSSLRVPVINRPTAASFCGPFPNPLGWRGMARALGVPMAAVEVRSDAFVNPFAPPDGKVMVEIACLAGDLVSPAGGAADAYTLALARHSGVEHLRAAYVEEAAGDARFLAAHTKPDAGSAAMRAALIGYFTGARR